MLRAYFLHRHSSFPPFSLPSFFSSTDRFSQTPSKITTTRICKHDDPRSPTSSASPSFLIALARGLSLPCGLGRRLRFLGRALGASSSFSWPRAWRLPPAPSPRRSDTTSSSPRSSAAGSTPSPAPAVPCAASCSACSAARRLRFTAVILPYRGTCFPS